MRWLVLVISIALYATAALVWVKNPTLPSEPLELTVEQAIAQLERDWKTYVSLPAELDITRRVYSTPVARPLYTLTQTNIAYPLLRDVRETGEGLDGYLGTVIHAHRPLEGAFIRLQWVEERIGEDEVESERILAPLAGTAGRVWAISPLYNDDMKIDRWLGRSSYEGPLTRLVDVEKNLESAVLYHDLNAIETQLREQFEMVLHEEMYLILTEIERGTENHFLVPVKNSSNTLFAVLREDVEVPNPMVALLESSAGEHYEDVGELLDVALPDTVGILSLGYSADQYNKRVLDDIKAQLFFGTVALAFAVIGFARSAFRKRRAAAQE